MKKSVIITTFALVAALYSHAGNGDLPKVGPSNETEITLNVPNDDPNAPPPTTNTYYTVKKKTSTGMTTAEKNAEPNSSWNSTLTVSYAKNGGALLVGTYLATRSYSCAVAFLNSKMCSTCSTWGKYYTLGSSVTTSNTIFVPVCE